MSESFGGIDDVMHFLCGFDSILNLGCGIIPLLHDVPVPLRVEVDICKVAIQTAEQQSSSWCARPFRERDLRHSRLERFTHYSHADCLKWISRPPHFLRVDLRKSLPFGPSSFECIVAIDVLEHLERDAALRMLSECGRVASKVVLIFCPIGVHEQEGDPWGIGNEQFNTHRSTWTVDSLANRGFEVWLWQDWFKEKDTRLTSRAAAFCLNRIGAQPLASGPIHTGFRYG